MRLFLIFWAVTWAFAFAAGFLMGEADGAIWALEYVDQSGVCD